MTKSNRIVLDLLQRSGWGSEVFRPVSEGAVFGLQWAALRVVVMKPAGSGFSRTRGNRLPFGICSGGLPVPPVSYIHPPSFHLETRNNRETSLVRVKVFLYRRQLARLISDIQTSRGKSYGLDSYQRNQTSKQTDRWSFSKAWVGVIYSCNIWETVVEISVSLIESQR